MTQAESKQYIANIAGLSDVLNRFEARVASIEKTRTSIEGRHPIMVDNTGQKGVVHFDGETGGTGDGVSGYDAREVQVCINGSPEDWTILAKDTY